MMNTRENWHYFEPRPCITLDEWDSLLHTIGELDYVLIEQYNEGQGRVSGALLISPNARKKLVRSIYSH